MKDINQNNASELLTLYMDGELDPSMVQDFEKELANNTELQSEYRDMLAIREAVQKDVKKLVPPYESTATVFESLGLSYTTSISSTSSIGMSLWQQLMVPIVSSISAALVTIGAFVGIDIDNNKVNNNDDIVIERSIPIENESLAVEENNTLEVEKTNDIVETPQKVENISASNSNNRSQLIVSNRQKPIKNTSNIIVPDNSIKEQNIQADNQNILIRDKFDFFELLNSNVISEKITMFNIGESSKFDFGYNKQELEYISSKYNRDAFYLGRTYFYGPIGIRASYSRNIISENKWTNYITGFSINWGNNLFINKDIDKNMYLSGDILLFDYQLSNILKFTPLIGIGYDNYSSSAFIKGGIFAESPIILPSIPFVIEGRVEYNTLLKQFDAYNQSNGISVFLGAKFKL